MRCRKVGSHGLAYPTRLQEARARWLGELKAQQYCRRHEGDSTANLLCKKLNSHGLTDPARLKEARARWLGELTVEESNLARISRPCKGSRGTSKTLQGCKRHEQGGSANLRCSKVNSHGLADPARLQEARARWLGELKTLQGCKRHERGGSANLRCMKVNSHGLADPPRLQEARAWWLGELAMHESKLARVSRPSKVARGTSVVARRTCDA
ncbi:hypothetical protein CRG98_024662 [Punica granatum]|uniref:Uncharacterized protein n=1 Tax=Punica granatum TaxID=22663 RepID=A0A2I0JG51_PUNGR|nr:hypothetical protein CRG98_024662 [Punica granatum]